MNIPNYDIVSNHRQNSKGGGIDILIHKGITYKHQKDLEFFKEKIVETTFVEIVAKDGKKIIVGSMY